jgi:tripartite ATP-independent transporter DctM subunit
MFMGTPVSVSMIISLILSILIFDMYAMISIATLFYSSLDSYLLVAIPLFMLAGIAMSFGGVARRIFDFSESILGFLPGSLGAVNIMASMIFGGLSGSSVADVAGLGSVEIKEMKTRNYPLRYAAALTIASSTMAVIIPPSILLIIYATIANASVGEMLAAGLVPGLFIAGLMIAANTYLAIHNKWVPVRNLSVKHVIRTGTVGIPAMLAPIIILGGIFFGTFTPTEASAIAFIYCVLIGVVFYRELNFTKLYRIIYEGGRTTGIVALELAAGLLFSNLITIEGIPDILTHSITGFTQNPILIMLMINIVLLTAGMFLNPGFSIIVFTPLLLPLAESIGYTPLHFGIIMVTNLALGLITPPVGACLYMGSVVSGLRVEQIIRNLIPFYFVLIIALLCIILLPQMSQGFVDLIY